MRIELQTVEPRYRQTHPIYCFVCVGRFVPGPATARAYGDDGLDCGQAPRVLSTFFVLPVGALSTRLALK